MVYTRLMDFYTYNTFITNQPSEPSWFAVAVGVAGIVGATAGIASLILQIKKDQFQLTRRSTYKKNLRRNLLGSLLEPFECPLNSNRLLKKI